MHTHDVRIWVSVWVSALVVLALMGLEFFNSMSLLLLWGAHGLLFIMDISVKGERKSHREL